MPVSAIMPDATADNAARAAATDRLWLKEARYSCSSRGSTNAQTTVTPTYSIGIAQSGRLRGYAFSVVRIESRARVSF